MAYTFLGRIRLCVLSIFDDDYTLLQEQVAAEEFSHRVISLKEAHGVYCDNTVLTSKYTILTFLPKNLFKQFRRLANFYFLVMSIIPLVVDSPVSPLASFFPLAVVTSVTAIKQGYEDWLRHREDKKTNAQSIDILYGNTLKNIKRQDIRVGNLVYVPNECDVPCDMVLLVTSSKDYRCHVTTANLDGETNLKRMTCPLNCYFTYEDAFHLTGKIICDLPSSDLYHFSGSIDIRQPQSSLPSNSSDFVGTRSRSKVCAGLNSENLLLMGSTLKNTEYVVGCAVYTGRDSKLSLNSCKVRYKIASSEKSINYILIFFFVILVLEVLLSVALEIYTETRSDYTITTPYIGDWPPFTFQTVVYECLQYLVLYYYIIPISLYISLELQRFLGAMYLQWDEEMVFNHNYARANTSDINEDLGQIEYIFTDKTGTLTDNEMGFKAMVVNGETYLEDDGKIYNECEHSESDTSLDWTPEIEKLLLAMSLCHSVQCSDSIENNLKTVLVGGQLPSYHGLSADENCLVEAAARCGMIYLGEEAGCIKLLNRAIEECYQKLHVEDFTSETMRMSVTVRATNGKVFQFFKGSQDAISPFVIDDDHSIHHNIDEACSKFASQGLRTLTFAWRELPTEHSSRDLLQTEPPDIMLLGVTAVMDNLQIDVEPTLKHLFQAKLKVFILTGDSVDTAVSVARSCTFLKSSGDLNTIRGCSSSQNVHEKLISVWNSFKLSTSTDKKELIMDGKSLNLVMKSPENLSVFKEIISQCNAGIFCRLSPKQKAEIVSLVKSLKGKPMTLAIGDGANDVAMIKEAHIGIGVMGKEGIQAAGSADFVLPRFAHLQRSLFVHGHWYYLRMAVLIQYFFYKNIVFITPQVFFAFYNGFSTQPLLDSVYLLFYNTLFTSVPILTYGLLEQDYSEDYLMKNPAKYTLYRGNSLLSIPKFGEWFLTGVWHACVVYFVPMVVMQENCIVLATSNAADLSQFGIIVLHCTVIVVNLKLLIYSRFWTPYIICSIVFSILFFVIFTLVYSYISFAFNGMYGSYQLLLSSPTFWALTIFVICISLIPDVFQQIVQVHSHSY